MGLQCRHRPITPRRPIAAEAARRGRHRMDPLQSLLNAVHAASTPAARMRALNALSTELARTGQATQAFELAKEAREIAARSGDRQLDAESLHALARCHFYLADFMPALEGMLQAAQLYQDSGDLAGAATAFAGIGLCQHRLGAHDDAVVSLLRALETARDAEARHARDQHLQLARLRADRGRARRRSRAVPRRRHRARAGARRPQPAHQAAAQPVARSRRRAATRAPPRMPPARSRSTRKGLAQATQALELARALGNVLRRGALPRPDRHDAAPSAQPRGRRRRPAADARGSAAR